jgi:hypothetical protein
MKVQIKNPKTTITALVGLIALLVGRYGIEISIETQLNIVTVTMFVVAYFARDGGNNFGGNSGFIARRMAPLPATAAKQLTALSLIFVFSVMLTACPNREKTIRTAREASAQMKIYGVRLIQANIDAFKAGEISRDEFARLNALTGAFIEGVKIYGDALHEIEVIADGATIPKATIDKLAAIFDAHVVDKFFAILEKLKITPGANSETVKAIISAIRLTILSIQSAFATAGQLEHRSEPQWT